MNKWKFDKEMTIAKNVLLNAYLETMHSDVITAIFTHNDNVYAYNLTTNDLFDLVTVTSDKLQINALGKKRVEKIINKSEKFSTVEKMDNLAKEFDGKNKGYVAEFLYRIEKNGETIEEIKHSNNSKGYEVASDTKDNRQLKNLNGKATFTSYSHIYDVCVKQNYKDIENVKSAIDTLKEIFSK
jgi:hypothetical protein